MRLSYHLPLAALTAIATRLLALPNVHGHRHIHFTRSAIGQHDPDRLTSRDNPNIGIEIQNDFGSNINAYVTGLDPDTQETVILQYTNTTQDTRWYFPPPNTAGPVPTPISEPNIAIPIEAGKSLSFSLPGFVESGRIWFAAGELQFNMTQALVEPSAVHPTDLSRNLRWGFVEFTNTKSVGIWANLSFVDWVGLILSMNLTTSSSPVMAVEGLKTGSIDKICAALQAQTKSDHQPEWEALCITGPDGQPLRVLSPNLYYSTNNSAFAGYYDEYVDQVWTKYTSQTLTIDTQNSNGVKDTTNGAKIPCQVDAGSQNLTCTGDLARTYAKPTTADVLSCNSGSMAVYDEGDFAHKDIVARLCAALVRSTLLLPGGDVQPSTAVGNATYYRTSPTNHYARILHENMVDGKGYTFPYDDVNPDGEDTAGVLVAADPVSLQIRVQK
ncbi:hypothetical protein BX600DRAFT_429640 [Xylariales sp. PMI_506]|nr:hypothetical protein BX600DRAFT_429640 [Xylariales sp. PMI_506]